MKTVKPKPSKTKKNSAAAAARFAARVKFGNKETPADITTSQADLSQLRKPIDISVSSLIQVTKLLEIGGDEVKTMLAYECDVIYECRVCRSLYRSLANFISHKRVYCREKFNVSLCRKTNYENIIPEEVETELIEVEEFKEDDNNRILRSQVVRNNPKKDLTSVLDMLQRKRKEDFNLTQTVAKNVRKFNAAVGRRGKLKEKAHVERIVQEPVLLEPIDGSKTAVYQTAVVRVTDLMKTQITELQNMIGRNTAIVNPDGQTVEVVDQLEKSDSPLQIYGSDEEDTECIRNLVCTVCNARFATRKTLTYHMKSLHVSYRTCYPCPCCNSVFANTWSVYRHLYKVHRKTNEQVRKLRTQIQDKAFRKETTGAEDIEKENAIVKSSSSSGGGGGGGSKKETTNNDARESLENFELDLEFQRCGGCGRRFDRKAALVSHSQTCPKRLAAASNERRSSNRRKRLSKLSKSLNKFIEGDEKLKDRENSDILLINVESKSVNEVTKKNETEIPSSSSSSSSSSFSSSSSSFPIDGTPEIISDQIPDLITTNNETSIRVENVSRITNDDWERIDNNYEKSQTTITTTTTTTVDKLPEPETENIYPIVENRPTNDEDDDDETSSSSSKYIKTPQSDAPEIIFTSIDKSRTVAISYGAKKRRVSVLNESKDKDTSISRVTETENLVSPRSDKSDSSNGASGHAAIMENRLAAIANLRKLQCLPCRQKFTSMTNLRRHMAIHIGWNRYRCKLCDFKCFVKCDCVAHCNKMHDAKNNRAVIADMVMQIPPDQNALAQDTVMDISSNSFSESSPEPEVIEVATPKVVELAEIRKEVSSGSQSPINEPEEPETEAEISSSKSKEDHEKSKTTQEKKETREDDPSDDPTARNQSQSKLDTDPDLRKMVMEVIFGTTETNAPSETKNRKLNGAKEVASCNDNSIKNEIKEIRPQRPMRNRVKPINEDFIYDLTELIRKESAIHRAALTTTNQKALRKKQSNNQQQPVVAADANEFSDAESRSDSAANDTTTQKLSSGCKLPALLSCNKKGTESGNYTSKFSLRQAEIKLHPASANGITTTLSNSIGSTKISVSGHK